MSLDVADYRLLLEIRSLLWNLERRVQHIEEVVGTTDAKVSLLEFRQSLASTAVVKQHATLPPKGSKKVI